MGVEAVDDYGDDHGIRGLRHLHSLAQRPREPAEHEHR